MLTVQIEIDGRMLGVNELIIPFTDAWLEKNSCRHLLAYVLAEHHQRADLLAIVEKINLLQKE